VASIALLFLYRDAQHIDLPAIEQVERAQRPARLPEGFTRDEVRAVLGQMEGSPRLMASLLYGSGLRLMEWVACGSRTSTSTAARSPSARAKARRTG